MAKDFSKIVDTKKVKNNLVDVADEGKKTHMLNIGLSMENYQFLKTVSLYNGVSTTAIINELIDDYRAANKEIDEQAKKIFSSPLKKSTPKKI